METVYTHNAKAIAQLFGIIIQRHISAESWNWLNERKNVVPGSTAFNGAFAAIPRKTGKAIIKPKEEELQSLAELRPGLSLHNWSVDQLSRIWLLLHMDISDEEKYIAAIEQLFLAAEMNELVALYTALPLLAYPSRWRKRCSDGIRSNIGDVLEAIICYNPYPSEQLDEAAWNQLVLKAFFTEKPIQQIYHLDQRANKKLAETLSDYAHERWSAGRDINPMAWRLVTPFIDEFTFPDIKKIASSSSAIEREVAALTCYYSSYQPAKDLLETMPQLKSKIENGMLTWQNL